MNNDADDTLDWQPKKSQLEIDEENSDNDMLDPVLNEQRRESRATKAKESRPVISHLQDAIVVQDGERILLADVGDEVVVESVTNNRWNFTKQITIHRIDDASGNVMGWDRARSQDAGFNYKTNDAFGVVVKLLTQPISLKKRRRSRRK
jgi:hypothetical protein